MVKVDLLANQKFHLAHQCKYNPEAVQLRAGRIVPYTKRRTGLGSCHISLKGKRFALS